MQNSVSVSGCVCVLVHCVLSNGYYGHAMLRCFLSNMWQRLHEC